MKASGFAALLLTSAISIASCGRAGTGRIVLQGNIEGDPDEVIVVSFLPGQDIGYHYPEVINGQFEFALDDVEGFVDLIVSVGGMEFGARVNALDTLKMGFVVNRYAEDVEVSYEGDTEKESRMWADFYETYERYSSYNIMPERDPGISWDESIAKLERNDSLFRAGHKADMDKYHTHRADLAHGLLKAIMLEQKAYDSGCDPYDFPEYAELLDLVDLDDPDEITFPMFYRWADAHEREFGDDPITCNIGLMKKYGRSISNPAIRQRLASRMLMTCLSDISLDSLDRYEALFTGIDNFVPEHPEIVESGRARIEAFKNAQPGKPVPEAALLAPDGSEVMLSSLYGKVLYIDVWATWCGPCVREAPHFKALAEKYRDDDRIRFISISIDTDKDAWLKFVNEEKPFWPQYIFTDSSHREFCDGVGINAIPRFLLIGPDGEFIDADCARPSDEEIDGIINKALWNTSQRKDTTR